MNSKWTKIKSIVAMIIIGALWIWLFAERCSWPDEEGDEMTCRYGFMVEAERVLRWALGS
jgi:hypothetical protein